MRWTGRRRSSNVEDRRGRGNVPIGRGGTPIRLPIGRGGGLSGFGLIVAGVLLYVFFGINPLALLDMGQQGGPAPQSQTGGEIPADDRHARFIATVLAETEDVWHEIFAEAGQRYEEPTLVLFSNGVRSACGLASSAAGPFYCPGDRQIYLDLDFFDRLERQFGATGDFAQAYVVAHEVGHHVQNLAGVLDRFHASRGSMSEAQQNRMSVRVELQADCFAGIWAHFTDQRGLIEDGDIEEALNAANQIGDDTIQRRSQGYAVPETFSHGTSQQRMEWFTRGYETGRLEACDTLDASL